MRYPRVRVVRVDQGWVVYACPSEYVSQFVGRTRWGHEAVRLAFRYIARFGGPGWVVEQDGREVAPPPQMDLPLEAGSG